MSTKTYVVVEDYQKPYFACAKFVKYDDVLVLPKRVFTDPLSDSYLKVLLKAVQEEISESDMICAGHSKNEVCITSEIFLELVQKICNDCLESNNHNEKNKEAIVALIGSLGFDTLITATFTMFRGYQVAKNLVGDGKGVEFVLFKRIK